MTRTIVHEGQNMLDVALQAMGDISRVFEIAKLNSLDITDTLTPGISLLTPVPAIDKKQLVEIYSGFERPKSGMADAEVTEGRTGIGFMAIEYDFIVK